MATLPDLDPPAVAEFGSRLAANIRRAVKVTEAGLRDVLVALLDEVNRASPKTQSGLLECMQERHVTVDKHTHELARPFLVLATQNPIEYEGTYPLPEAQLDRFMVRVSLGYP